jgi:hypothetical protein
MTYGVVHTGDVSLTMCKEDPVRAILDMTSGIYRNTVIDEVGG